MTRAFLFQSGDVAFVAEGGARSLKPIEFRYRADTAEFVAPIHRVTGTIVEGEYYADTWVGARFSDRIRQANLYLECDCDGESCAIEFRNVSVEPNYRTEPRIYLLDCVKWLTDPHERLRYCERRYFGSLSYLQAPEKQRLTKEQVARRRLRERGWSSLYRQARAVALPLVTIPSIRATVVDEAGQPVAGAKVCSHTRRHWVRLHTGGRFHENPHGSLTETDSQGRFGLPTRKERYRVLVVHDRGVASMDYEELLESKRVVLRPWARVEGTVVFDGEPQAREELTLRVDTSSWSYGRGGPRVTLDYRATTDEEGRFAFEAVPPLPGQIYRLAETEGGAVLSHLTPFVATDGETSTAHLGTGHTVTGRLRQRSESEDPIDWATVGVTLFQPNRPIPVPNEIRQQGNRAAEQLWIRGWKSSGEGRRWYAEHERRMNQRYLADVAADGSFQVHGLTEGEYAISVRDKGTSAMYGHAFPQTPSALWSPWAWNRLKISEETATPLDLGELLVAPMPAPASEGFPE